MTVVALVGSISDFITKFMVHSLGRSETSDLATDHLGVIRKAQLDAIIATSRPMMFANLANAAALLIIEVNVTELSWPTVIWSIVVAMFAVFGLKSAFRYGSTVQKKTAGIRAPGKVTLTSTLLALIWCYPIIFILPDGTPVEIAFVSALTAGMVAGGALALYPVPLAGLIYTSILSSVAFGVLVFSGVLPSLPFGIVIIAFGVVVIHSVLRHGGMFLAELVGKLEAQRQRDVTNMLVASYQGEGGQYLWRCDRDMCLKTDPMPLYKMLNVEPYERIEASLVAILERAGMRFPLEPDKQGGMSFEERILQTSQQVKTNIRLHDNRTIEFVGRPEAPENLIHSGFHGYIKDITAETRAAEEIQRLASYDTMTGLFNYRKFLAEAEAWVAKEGVPRQRVVFLFVDADNLKAVNDNFGHAAGDLLIKEISFRLQKHLPEGSLIARKGGDEFVALFQTADLRNLNTWATDFLNNMCGDFENDTLRIPVSCCVGISHASPQSLRLCNLELEADRALYHAKSQGKRQVRAYDEEIGKEIHRDRVLARDLEVALERNELYLDFQPIHNAGDNTIVGAEALLRWHHGTLGKIAPEKLVSIAQCEGLGMALFNYVLTSAILATRRWPANQFVSVNMTSAELRRHDLAKQVLGVLESCDFSPDRLWLEVTESQALHQIDEVRINLEKLRAAGILIAIDDFGSGYSSLSLIGEIPADVVKVDRDLVRNCDTRESNQVILKAVSSLADATGLRLVAEGAETTEEVAFLVKVGFDMIQGFALSRPIPSASFSNLALKTIQDSAINYKFPALNLN